LGVTKAGVKDIPSFMQPRDWGLFEVGKAQKLYLVAEIGKSHA